MASIFDEDSTFLSNMQECKRASTLKAMEKFPNQVKIVERALDSRGRVLPEYFALHAVDEGRDLSAFWREYDRLEAIRNG